MVSPRIRLNTLVDDAGRAHPHPDFISQADIDSLRRGLKVRAGDVFVSSYPKSGTTWLQQICHLIARGGVQGEQAIVDTVPWVEAHAMPEKVSLAALEACKERRWMQIHSPWSLAPKGEGARYLYVARNPRDVAVSFFYHQRAKQRDPAYTGDFAHFVAAFIAGRVPYGSWFDHVREWWAQSQTSDAVLFLRYEDMLADLGTQLARITRFLDCELSPEVHASIVEQSSFAHMKRGGIGEPRGELRSRTGESAHLRKGTVGDWRHHFDAVQVAAMDAVTEREFANSGLEFEFAPPLG